MAVKADAYFREQSERLGVGAGSGAAAGAGAGKSHAKKAKSTADEAAKQAAAADEAAHKAAHQAEARDGLMKLVQGDMDPFVALAHKDVGFPFEPEARGALKVLFEQNPADYQRLRARVKAETSVVMLAFDDIVRGPGSGGDLAADGLPGRAVSYAAIEPWAEPVDGAELLTEVANAIGSYVVMDAQQRDATALWATFTHAHDLRDYAPLLVITSPMKRCGKTRLEETLARLAPKAQPSSGLTAALMPRLIERHHPTLLVDEFDAMMKGDKEMAEMLRGLLNSSFNRAGAVVLKLVSVGGGDWQERQFSIWTPACIAGIGRVPETVEDRSVIIRLIRKLTGERVKRLRGEDGGELAVLRQKIARWVADNEQALRTKEPAGVWGLNDRQADAWEPLFAIAEVAGGDWPERARAAAKALCQTDNDEARDDDVRLVLLADIRDIFAKTHPEGHPDHQAVRAGRPDDGPRLTTNQLLEGLHAIEERPWAVWGRSKKPITGMGLAALLRPYGVRSGTIRTKAGTTPKGYYLHSFDDAFTRYLPDSADPSRHAATNAEKQGESEVFADATKSECGGYEKPANPSNSRFCGGVAAPEDENGVEEDSGGSSSGSDKPVVLDLYCGAGGVARGLKQAGFLVIGVDISPQPNYCGDVFIQSDALTYLKAADLSDYALIWASPPCQAYSVLRHAPGEHRSVDLIAATRELIERARLPYIIENVEGARSRLVAPVTLCGTMFGLETPDGAAELQRHRLFECSFPVLTPPCQHSGRAVIGVYGGHFRNRQRPPKGAKNPEHSPDSNFPREHGFAAMGVPLGAMTNEELSESIPPAYANFLAEAFLRWRVETQTQIQLSVEAETGQAT
jgi:hypothetical protein